MKKILFLFFIVCSIKLFSSDILYYKPIIGHVHKNTSKYSSSLTTISCGFPLKVSISKQLIPPDWNFVKAGGYEGYVLKKYLLQKKELCFQEKYQKFYNLLNMNLTQLYYWGRLYDQFIQSEVELP